MSEFQPALGLFRLKHVADAIAKRKAIDYRYREQLTGVGGITFSPRAQDRITGLIRKHR